MSKVYIPPAHLDSHAARDLRLQKRFLLSEEQCSRTVSRADGISEEIETSQRRLGALYILEAGKLLELSSTVIMSSQMLFQRYFYIHSMARSDVKTVAMGSLFLAAKVGETHRLGTDIVNSFHYVFCTTPSADPNIRDETNYKPLLKSSKEFSDLRNGLIEMERRLLRAIGFVIWTELPHRFLPAYSRTLSLPQDAIQHAWNFATDAFQTTVNMRYPAEVIACAAVDVAARKSGLTLPFCPPWWKLFQCKRSDIDSVMNEVLNLNNQPRPEYVDLKAQRKDKELSERIERLKEQAAIAAAAAIARSKTPDSEDSMSTPPYSRGRRLSSRFDELEGGHGGRIGTPSKTFWIWKKPGPRDRRRPSDDDDMGRDVKRARSKSPETSDYSDGGR